MTYRIDLLERCLRAWEDYWFLIRILLKAKKNAPQRGGGVVPRQQEGDAPRGALANFQNLRSFLLSECVTAAATGRAVDMEQFRAPPEYSDVVPPSVANLPFLLFCWSAYSRRMYRLTAELQTVLRATSLHRTRWEDIELPFPAFGIELEQPFKDPDGEEFSLVFVYSVKTPEGEAWYIQTLSDSCLNYEPLASTTKELWKSRSNKGKAALLLKDAERQIQSMGCVGGYSFALLPGDKRELVQRTSRRLASDNKLSAGAALAFEHMIRTVVGVMLYLKALPPGSPHVSAWTKPHLPKTTDPRAVTKGTEVCNVSSIYALSAEERALMDQGEPSDEHPERAMSTHFRSGHWRRRRGSGDDPLAPKVEHVRWTIVRRDRLPETGGLPHGTIQVLGS